MWIESLKMTNIRSFKSEEISFSKGINVIVGANNCGKSTIIGSIAHFQGGGRTNGNAKRIGEKNALASINLMDAQKYFEVDQMNMDWDLNANSVSSGDMRKSLPNQESDYFIYPFLSHRKVERYDENPKKSEHNRVRDDNAYLAYRLTELSNSTHPAHKEYHELSNDILGFSVSNVTATNGTSPGIYFGEESIPLENMGDGVGMITSFLVRLAGARGRLFLIEEPENDLHPKALKKLLKCILKASQYNQFIISTHSNIVVRALGVAKETKIISLTKPEGLTESVTQVKYLETPEDRNQALLELGYDVNDLDSYDAWLFFEEASMEKIVREILIPIYVPQINGRVRTFSTKGFGNIESRFEELNSLFIYLHLDSKYKNRAWAFVDNGENEKKMLARLKNTYVDKHKWDANCFIELSKADLEDYYPDNFREAKAKIKEANADSKRHLKTKLVEDFLTWFRQDSESKRIAADSFAEVINHLKKVEKSLNSSKS